MVPEGSTPPNWMGIFLVFISIAGSAFSITFLFPFLPEMVLFFGYAEVDKGYYAGLIASSMFLGRFFGSYFWGWLADVWGRKPVLLVSLFLTSIATGLFGFARSQAYAMSLRFLVGILNGIVGTGKSILYEISDNSNQAVGMGSIALSWGAGIVFGPLISGHLAQPAVKYPHVFKGTFFDTFPFLLPSLVAAVLPAVALVCVWALLPETLNKRKDTVKFGLPEETTQTSEEGPTTCVRVTKTGARPQQNGDVRHRRADSDVSSDVSADVSGLETLLGVDLQYIDSGAELSAHAQTYGLGCRTASEHRLFREPPSDEKLFRGPPSDEKLFRGPPSDEKLFREPPSDNAAAAQTEVLLLPQAVPVSSGSRDPSVTSSRRRRCSPWEVFMKTTLYELLSVSAVRFSLGLFMLLSFAIIGWEEVVSVWASTDVKLGGLGFSSSQIGNAIGMASTPLLFLQFFLFPVLERNLGSIKAFQIFCGVAIFIASTYQCARYFWDRPAPQWTLLLLTKGVMAICGTTCFSAVGLLLNNSAPKHRAGTVNGIGNTLASIMRFLAPTVGGSLFGWSITRGATIGFPLDVNLVFLVFGLVFLSCNTLTVFLPEHLNRQNES